MIRDTLLIIDDSELDLAILNEIFKNLFRVECVAEARRGLSFLHHHHEQVCAVLLDICLERRGAGFTVLHQLQGNPATACLPVILITTDANEKDVRASVERGAVDFLVKPVDPHTVQDRVCAVVRAAWPPHSTILDQEAASSSIPEDAQSKENQGPVRLFPRGLALEDTQALCQELTEKLEAFCRLRPALSAESCRKVSAITGLLAKSYAEQNPDLGLTPDDAALMGMAAVFCDIGLLGLPDRLLENGEDQQEEDYYRHTLLGQALFAGGEDVPLLRYAGEMALWHHKNIDGSGFPWDAEGTAIPLSGRLVHAALRIQHYLRYYQGCADVNDRLLRALRSESGVMIDPKVCQALEQGGEPLWAALRAL